MNKLIFVAFLLVLCGCAATGPLSAPAAAGAAAMIAVFDQLLAGGVVDPMQHQSLVQSVQALEKSVEIANSNSISPETAAAGAGGLAAAVLGAIRVWRGPSTKATKTA